MKHISYSVFLGAPIQHAGRADDFYSPLRRDIEGSIAGLQGAGFAVFSAHREEQFGALEAQFTPERVTKRDLSWMRQCDLYVAILPSDPDGRLMRTDGTHVELGWASALETPVMLFVDSACEQHLSFLVRGLHTVADVQIVKFETKTGCPAEFVVTHVYRRFRSTIAAAERAIAL